MKTTRGFSLVEVILSLGILSIALLIVFGILTPLLTQTGEISESSTVNQIADRIKAEVEQLNFKQLKSILDKKIGLLASRDGAQLLAINDPNLDKRLPETERYFRIKLNRNSDLSPEDKDSSSGFLAIQIKIERIVRAPDGTELPNDLDNTVAIFNTAILKGES